MTAAQRIRFYFPVWSETAARLDWKMAGGRLIADLDVQLLAAEKFPDHARDAVQCIIRLAQKSAAAAHRAANADDLRHACNSVASRAKTKSSTRFTQRDLNHFDRLCAVLRDPWDMNALLAWNYPEEDDRQRTVSYLRTLANEGRLVAISLNAWGTPEWDRLEQKRLDALIAEIKNKAWQKYPRREREAQPY